MSALARKPYDRARLDVVAGLAGGPILEIGGDREVLDYFASLSKEAIAAPADRLPERGAFGGAVAYDSLLDLSRDSLAERLSEISRLLAPGAPLLMTLTSLSRDEAEEVLSASAFDPIRVEARRPYLFEPPQTRVFLTARRR